MISFKKWTVEFKAQEKNTRISNKRGYSKFLTEFQGASSESYCSCVEGTYLWNGRCEALFYVMGEMSHGFFKKQIKQHMLSLVSTEFQ